MRRDITQAVTDLLSELEARIKKFQSDYLDKKEAAGLLTLTAAIRAQIPAPPPKTQPGGGPGADQQPPQQPQQSPNLYTGALVVGPGGTVYSLGENGVFLENGKSPIFNNVPHVFTVGRIGIVNGQIWVYSGMRASWAHYHDGATHENSWSPYWPPGSTPETGGVVLDQVEIAPAAPGTPDVPVTPPTPAAVWTLDATTGLVLRDGVAVRPQPVGIESPELHYASGPAEKVVAFAGFGYVRMGPTDRDWFRFEDVDLNPPQWVAQLRPGVNYSGWTVDAPGDVPTVPPSALIDDPLLPHVPDPSKRLRYLGVVRLRNGADRTAADKSQPFMGYAPGKFSLVRFPNDDNLYVAVVNSETGEGTNDSQITLFEYTGNPSKDINNAPRLPIVAHYGQPWRLLDGTDARRTSNTAGPRCHGLQQIPDSEIVLATYADSYNVTGQQDPTLVMMELKKGGSSRASGPYRAGTSAPDLPVWNACSMTRGEVLHRRSTGEFGLHAQIASGNASGPWGTSYHRIQGLPQFGTPGQPAALSGDLSVGFMTDPVVYHSIRNPQRRQPDALTCEMLSRWGNGSQPFGSFPYELKKGACHQPATPFFSGLDVVSAASWLAFRDGSEVLMFGGHLTRGHKWYGSPHNCAHGLSGQPMSQATGDAASEHRLTYWLYDPMNLGRDPMPRYMTDFGEQFKAANVIGQIGAIKQDLKTGLVFMCEQWADVMRYSPNPVIHVFEEIA